MAEDDADRIILHKVCRAFLRSRLGLTWLRAWLSML